MAYPLRTVALSEFTATTFLLIAVVGSGIAAERLSAGNTALALLANAIVTGCALFSLIVSFAPISGAHMNPVVTLGAAGLGKVSWKAVPVMVGAQVAGGLAGVTLSHIMFELPVLQTGAHVRTGAAQWCAEIVATIGLLGVILRCENRGVPLTAAAVATYITGAYWFTASTSFANPAVTIARAFTDTFAGIRPADTPGFIVAQIAGLAVILAAAKALGANAQERTS